MRIIENRRVHEVDANLVRVVSNEQFLRSVLGEPKQIHFASRNGIAGVDYTRMFRSGVRESIGCQDYGREYPSNHTSQLVQVAHNAFSAHAPLSLSPEVIWYAIVHEIAIYIKNNSEYYSEYFTATPSERKKIEVRDDSLVYGGENDWGRAIGLFRKPIAELVPTPTVELLLPKFSTSTPESEIAILVSFMDVISKYYSFEMHTLCGIPRIRLEGTPEDWRLIEQHARTCSEIFPGLVPYFQDLVPVLREFAGAAASSGSTEHGFWTSLYKYKDNSGGPRVSGWITALFAHVPTPAGFMMKREFDWEGLHDGFGGYGVGDFPMHVSTVDFNWDYYGKNIPMGFAAGILGVDHDDGFLAPRLGFAVYEPEARQSR